MSKSKARASYPLPRGIETREGDFVTVAAEDWEKFTVQRARVFRTGNSLGIRIPAAIAKQCALEDGQPVDMAVSNGMIHIRKPQRALDDLIAGITSENVHGEMIETLVGRERW